MFTKVVTFYLFAVAALAQGRSDHRWEYHQEDPQPYDFGYRHQLEHGGQVHQHEIGDAQNNKKGSYGYTSPDGLYRNVEYVADKAGFRATIKTNEPGIVPQNPASVKIITSDSSSSRLQTGRHSSKAYSDANGVPEAPKRDVMSLAQSGVVRKERIMMIPMVRMIQMMNGAQMVQVNKDGQVLPMNEGGQMMQVNRGQMIQVNGGQMMQANEGQMMQTNEKGQMMQANQGGQMVQANEGGQMVQSNEKGQMVVKLIPMVRMVQTNEGGRAFQMTEGAVMVQVNQDGQMVPMTERGQMVQANGDGQMIMVQANEGGQLFRIQDVREGEKVGDVGQDNKIVPAVSDTKSGNLITRAARRLQKEKSSRSGLGQMAKDSKNLRSSVYIRFL